MLMKVMKQGSEPKYKIIFTSRRPRFIDGMRSVLGSEILSRKYLWYMTASDKEIDGQSIHDDWQAVGRDIINSMNLYEQDKSSRLIEGQKAKHRSA